MAAVVAAAGPKTVNHMVYVPDLQREIQKQAAMKMLNGPQSKISADRTLRVRSAHVANNAASSRILDLNLDPWAIEPGKDVTVLFENASGAGLTQWLGRITKMVMVKASGRKVVWTDPVFLGPDRSKLAGLKIYFHWYERATVRRGHGRGPHTGYKVYRFTHADNDPQDVENIHFPITLTYIPSTELYNLDPGHDRILQTVCGGAP